MTKKLISRRSALKAIGVGAGAVAALPWLSDEGLAAFAEVQRTGAAPALRVLSASQYATLVALTEAIIPADERSPGATEARVADYVDLLLSESDDMLKKQWLDGLAALEAEATRQFGAAFSKLDASQVDGILQQISRNERAAAPEPQKTPAEAFFALAKRATIHGYYTSEIGIHKELRYKGNQILAEFVGCLTVDGKDCPHCGRKAKA